MSDGGPAAEAALAHPTPEVPPSRRDLLCQFARPFDVAGELCLEVVRPGELARLAHPGDQVDCQLVAVEVSLESDKVGLEAPLRLAERRARADVDGRRPRPPEVGARPRVDAVCRKERGD